MIYIASTDNFLKRYIIVFYNHSELNNISNYVNLIMLLHVKGVKDMNLFANIDECILKKK